jgi:predicted acylesterase/phospholipase RssA
METSARPPLAVCLGGGGSVALGFALGISDGLHAEGIALSTSPLVGTSGGSHAAVAIRAGMTFDAIAPVWAEYVANSKTFWVRAYEIAEKLYGAVHVSDVAGVAVRLLWFRRTLLWAPEIPPADLVAASSSPVPFTRPHKIGRRRYIDGGFRSNTSADLVPAADLELVISPLMDPRQGFVGKLGARKVRKETAKWTKAHDGAVEVIGPNEAIGSLPIKGMKSLGDIDLGRQVYDLAVPLGKEWAGNLRRDHPDIVARIPAPPQS